MSQESDVIGVAKVKLAEAEQKTGMERVLALMALAQFLLNRGLVVVQDVQARGAFDDQGVLDAAKRHDGEAHEAWLVIEAATAPVE